jgi:hypothetical protein
MADYLPAGLEDLDRLIPVERPLLEVAGEPPGEIEAAFGRHVASLVPSGATLLVRIGFHFPTPCCALFRVAKILGIHTEMLLTVSCVSHRPA